MAKPQSVPDRFGPHETFPGQGKATGRPAFVEDLIPFDRDPVPVCIEVSIDVGTILTPVVVGAAGGNFCFSDATLTLTNVVLRNFGNGDRIDVTGACAHDYNFARSFGDVNDLVITFSDPSEGVLTIIVIDDVLPDSGAVVDLSTAIAAVGFDFISFDQTGRSIDVGNAMSADPPVNIDASDAAYCLLDDSDVSTFVVIQGFSSDDHIDVTGASVGDYSFSTGADPHDLAIVFFNTAEGVMNSIVLDDVVPDGAGLIDSYATAVSAIGYDFMTFA